MIDVLGFLGKPLGILMGFIYQYVPYYFLTIFIFTFLVRLVLFPLNLKQQKSTMERARLAPALERIQKKYANDRQKLAEKQQALYEKHGVSMTGGCLPLLASMLVLFGVIAAIYSPLVNMARPSLTEDVISVAQYAVIAQEGEDENVNKIPQDKVKSKLNGYYGELNLMQYAEENKDDIVEILNNPTAEALDRAYSDVIGKDGKVNETEYKAKKKAFQAKLTEKYNTEAYGEVIYNQIVEMKKDFDVPVIGSLLKTPWNDKGFKGISWLWLVPLISGLTSLGVSYISMQFTKKSQPQQMPGQGCTNNMMLIYMPLFSTWIAFTVPGAVGIYWIFSNVLSVVQTILMNKIYDPAKARAQAEKEYQERRQKKDEDKKRLAQARQREEAEARKAEQEKERQREESREMNKKKKKKNNGGATQSAPADSEDATEQTVETDETAASDE